MIQRLMRALHTRPALSLSMLLAYVLFIVFGHDPFVRLSVSVMNSLSLPMYDRVVAFLFAALLTVLLVAIVRAWQRGLVVEKRALPFLLLSMAGLVVHFFLFTEMNIEFIHALEFGLLAVILYAIVGRYGAALVAALPVMLFDEWYQYKVLYPETVEYFDLNDIVLDLWGAGLFLSLVRFFRAGIGQPYMPIWKRPELYVLLGLFACVGLLLASSVIVPYPQQAGEHTWLVLNEVKDVHGFWRVHPLIGSTYHLLQPVPGLVMVFSICALYLLMDPISSAK